MKDVKYCSRRFTLVLNGLEWHVLRCLLDDYYDPVFNTVFSGEDWQDFVKSCNGKPVEYLRHKMDSVLSAPCFTLVLNGLEWHVLRCLLDDYDDPVLNTVFFGEDWQDFVKSCNGKPVEYLRHKMDALLSDDKDGEVK